MSSLKSGLNKKKISFKGVELPKSKPIPKREVKGVKSPLTDEELVYSNLSSKNPHLKALVDKFKLVSENTFKRLRIALNEPQEYKEEIVLKSEESDTKKEPTFINTEEDIEFLKILNDEVKVETLKSNKQQKNQAKLNL